MRAIQFITEINGSIVNEGIFDRFKKKSKPAISAVTAEQRQYISKFFPNNNGSIKYSDGTFAAQSVLVTGEKAVIYFSNYDGKLEANVLVYPDGYSHRKSPLMSFQKPIVGDQTMKDLAIFIDDLSHKIDHP